MSKHLNCNFVNGVTIDLDNDTFEGCTFDGGVFLYCGETPVYFANNKTHGNFELVITKPIKTHEQACNIGVVIKDFSNIGIHFQGDLVFADITK